MAVRPGGRGDVSQSHVVWESATGAPYIRPVYDAGLIYMATDVAVTVVDAKQGRRIAATRRRDLFGFASCGRRQDLFRERDR